MLIDDLRTVFVPTHRNASGFDDAEGRLIALIAAFDALAPDWATVPAELRYVSIDFNGHRRGWEHEPQLHDEHGYWWQYVGSHTYMVKVDLPEGIDWRICLWRRPEATQ